MARFIQVEHMQQMELDRLERRMGKQDSPCLKREEYKHTKHDSCFSSWKILIGPSDWENHFLGKDGGERYRTENLPPSLCPGLYELGIFRRSDVDREARRVDPRRVIVTYLGQADNVRARLQQYGRDGAHLDQGSSNSYSAEKEVPFRKSSPGLFTEILRSGFAIVFRWAQISSKKEAERTEKRLLQTFDYAWNKRGNGARRREDIPVKLDTAVSKNVPITKVLGFFNDFKFGKQQAGIRISGTVPAEDPPKRFPSSHADPQAKLVPSVFKFSKSRPQLVLGGFFANEDPSICGQILSDGSVCMNKPVQGSKCCGKHEKRVNATVPKFMVDKEYTPNAITDGSQYMEHPAFGPKGRELHGRRITTSSSPMLIGTEKSRSVNPQFTWDQWIDIKYDSICGVITSDGCVCRNKPVKNRKRCSAHKGQRISGSHSRSVEVEEGPIKDTKVGICGTSLEDGRICLESPEYGRERLVLDKGWTAPLLDGEHTGQRISGSPFRSGIAEEGPARDTKMGICGASLQNGGICSRSPVYGRKRCALHKGRRAPLLDGEYAGQRISELPFWSGKGEDSPATDTKMGICGASLPNGGICSRSPVHGRKRCALHKGRRAPLLYDL